MTVFFHIFAIRIVFDNKRNLWHKIKPKIMGQLNFIGIIPARYASTRFPGKPLAMLGGKPVIQHVYEKAAEVLGTA